MEVLKKYSLSFLLLFGMFLFEGCTDETNLDPEEEQVVVSLNFSSSGSNSSRTPSRVSEVNNNAENFLKTVRILVFSCAEGKKAVYNELISPNKYQNYTTRMQLNPGTYDFHIVANEATCMTEVLKGISKWEDFYKLPCLKKVKREDGMIMERSNIVAFLMKGEKKNVNVHKPSGGGELTVPINLKRLLAKVEVRFENKLSPSSQSSFNSFQLGEFPRSFSFFEEGVYPNSKESGDNEKQWEIDKIDLNKSYVHYIPPFNPKGTNTTNEEFSNLHFLFKWSIGGLQNSQNITFRESNDNQNEYCVKSNFHYQYNIRLSKAPQNPLEVQCTIAPWKDVPEQEYYIDDQCNLKIERVTLENNKEYTKFTLQHVGQDTEFEFRKEIYNLQIDEYRGFDTYVRYNNGGEITVGRESPSNWDGYGYKVAFRNDGTGTATLHIRNDYNLYYGRCYFNNKKIYDLQQLDKNESKE